MFAFMELDSVYWLICGLLVTGCVVSVVIVLVLRARNGVARRRLPNKWIDTNYFVL